MTEQLPAWPAAERNKQPILDVLQRVLPHSGLVLELASATGQHAEHFARALPTLTFQTSDHDPEHLTTLARRAEMVGLPNLPPPLRIDVTEASWPIERADAIYNANMIHIAPWAVTLGLFAGAARVLPKGATLITYGPYSFDGQHTSESNARFDESLKERNPEWGVRDVSRLKEVARGSGFQLTEQVAMPANNFTLLWRHE